MSIPVSALKVMISEVRSILLDAILLLVIIMTLFVKKQGELLIMTIQLYVYIRYGFKFEKLPKNCVLYIDK